MFGETYHVAAAMLLTPLVLSIEYHDIILNCQQDAKDRNPISNDQKKFFAICKASMLCGATPSQRREIISKNVSTSSIVAPAFTKDPIAAYSRLRNGFFHEDSLDFNDYANHLYRIKSFLSGIDNRLTPDGNPKAVIWIRSIESDKRNMTRELIGQIVARLGMAPHNIREIIFVGDEIGDGQGLPVAEQGQIFYNFIKFYRRGGFTGLWPAGKFNSFSAQLLAFLVLYEQFNVKMIIGMKSGAMDGPAFIGVPTIFFDEGVEVEPTSRMYDLAKAITWMKRVPFSQGSYNSVAGPRQMPTDAITVLDAAITSILNPRQ